jgi:cysteine desulfurase
MTRHYLDHASTSPPRPEVVDVMVRWLHGATPAQGGEAFVAADPGRVHTEGRLARGVLEDARERVATFLGTRPRQVIFTASGTEAINAAVFGATRARPGAPVLLAEVEHSAVRDASARLAPLTVLPVDPFGRLHAARVADALGEAHRLDTIPALVHCQLANHEVGTVQPVAEIAELCREAGVLLHVDACAAVGRIPLDLDALGADLVSVSAHKMGGPPGVGALVVRRGLRVEPLLVGGDQERARRAGLENLPAVLGFAAAATVLGDPERLCAEATTARERTERLARITEGVTDVTRLGDPSDRLPDLLCVAVGGLEAEPVLLGLDQSGIAAHSGSSCASESLAPSPVLLAMGAEAERSLRLSVGWSTLDADLDAFADTFPRVVGELRELRR